MGTPFAVRSWLWVMAHINCLHGQTFAKRSGRLGVTQCPYPWKNGSNKSTHKEEGIARLAIGRCRWRCGDVHSSHRMRIIFGFSVLSTSFLLRSSFRRLYTPSAFRQRSKRGRARRLGSINPIFEIERLVELRAAASDLCKEAPALASDH